MHGNGTLFDLITVLNSQIKVKFHVKVINVVSKGI